MLQAKDIENIGELIEPEKLEMTFSTPGWYAVYVLVCLIIVFIIYKSILHWRKNKYRRSAISKIKNQKDTISVSDINEIIKIVAIQSYERKDVANLSLESWVEFLNSKSKIIFNKKSFEFIYTNKEIDKKSLESFVNDSVYWIGKHKI